MKSNSQSYLKGTLYIGISMKKTILRYSITWKRSIPHPESIATSLQHWDISIANTKTIRQSCEHDSFFLIRAPFMMSATQSWINYRFQSDLRKSFITTIENFFQHLLRISNSVHHWMMCIYFRKKFNTKCSSATFFYSMKVLAKK